MERGGFSAYGSISHDMKMGSRTIDALVVVGAVPSLALDSLEPAFINTGILALMPSTRRGASPREVAQGVHRHSR
jgi:hypothetical protein